MRTHSALFYLLILSFSHSIIVHGMSERKREGRSKYMTLRKNAKKGGYYNEKQKYTRRIKKSKSSATSAIQRAKIAASTQALQQAFKDYFKKCQKRIPIIRVPYEVEQIIRNHYGHINSNGYSTNATEQRRKRVDAIKYLQKIFFINTKRPMHESMHLIAKKFTIHGFPTKRQMTKRLKNYKSPNQKNKPATTTPNNTNKEASPSKSDSSLLSSHHQHTPHTKPQDTSKKPLPEKNVSSLSVQPLKKPNKQLLDNENTDSSSESSISQNSLYPWDHSYIF